MKQDRNIVSNAFLDDKVHIFDHDGKPGPGCSFSPRKPYSSAQRLISSSVLLHSLVDGKESGEFILVALCESIQGLVALRVFADSVAADDVADPASVQMIFIHCFKKLPA